MRWGLCREEKHGPQPGFGGGRDIRGFFWRKGDSELSIKGGARVSLAKG